MKKRDEFLIAMLEATTTKQAWERAGISRTTAYQYLGDKSFKKELQDLRNEVLSHAVQYLQVNLGKCSAILMDIVEDAKTPASVKVQAINSVFSNYKNMTETIELRERIEKLEERGGMDEILSD
jgi:AcrR family transcriptional regulator